MASRQKRRVIEPVEDDPFDAYDERYLECRSINHRWSVLGFYHDPYGAVVRSVRCDRCETTRRDLWTSRGARLGNRYSYPEGYQMKGQGGVSREEVRVATLKRVRVFDNEQAMFSTLLGRS